MLNVNMKSRLDGDISIWRTRSSANLKWAPLLFPMNQILYTPRLIIISCIYTLFYTACPTFTGLQSEPCSLRKGVWPRNHSWLLSKKKFIRKPQNFIETNSRIRVKNLKIEKQTNHSSTWYPTVIIKQHVGNTTIYFK